MLHSNGYISVEQVLNYTTDKGKEVRLERNRRVVIRIIHTYFWLEHTQFDEYGKQSQ